MERGSERNIACQSDLESDPIFLGPDVGQFSLDEVVDVFKCGHQSGTLVALDLGHSSDYVGVNLRQKMGRMPIVSADAASYHRN